MDSPIVAKIFQQEAGSATGGNGTQIQGLGFGLHGLLRQYPIQCVGASLIVAVLTTIILSQSYSYSFPSSTKTRPVPILEINPVGGFFSPSKTKSAIQAYLTNARGLVTDFFSLNPRKLAAKLHTQIGTIIVLASSTTDEIAHDERFHLRKQTAKTFNAHLPGFEVFRDDYNNQLIKGVVTKYLNKQLTKITGTLAGEMDLALGELFHLLEERTRVDRDPFACNSSASRRASFGAGISGRRSRLRPQVAPYHRGIRWCCHHGVCRSVKMACLSEVDG